MPRSHKPPDPPPAPPPGRTGAASDKPSTEAAAATPSFRPLYQQIKTLLMGSLQAGEWKPGDVIPSEQELAQRFGVSQGTVRKAVDELAADNLLMRRQGKGTFVASHAEARTQYRFLRLLHDDGSQPQLQRRLLSCRKLRAPAEVARALRLRGGSAEPGQALQVQRLLLADGQPVVFDELWLPAARFKGLNAERLEGYKGTLYGLFESEFDVHMTRAEEQIRAVAAQVEEARLMQVAAGAPLLQVQRLSFTYGEEPVEWRRGLYHTGQHHYRNLLT